MRIFVKLAAGSGGPVCASCCTDRARFIHAKTKRAFCPACALALLKRGPAEAS